MAHNINFNQQTGEHSFFSVKEKPWHGLGKTVDAYPTSAQAIKYAGLDYLVEKRPLFTCKSRIDVNNTPNESPSSEINVPNYFATVREDTNQVLGVVGRGYNIVQNCDAFSFFDSIVGSGQGIMYETAGALGNGERIFITAKLPGYIKVGSNGDDLIEKYLFLTTSHDGFGSIIAAFTPIRIVCNNTLTAALNNMSNGIKIRHNNNAREKLKQANKIMGITDMLSGQLNDILNHWTKVKITDKELIKLVHLAMAPNKEALKNVQDENLDKYSRYFLKSIDGVCSYAFNHSTQRTENTEGTLYGAFNAITGYFQNVKQFKDGESRLKSVFFGEGLNRAQKAFNLCREFEKNGINAFDIKLN